jgi:hypothetical protein
MVLNLPYMYQRNNTRGAGILERRILAVCCGPKTQSLVARLDMLPLFPSTTYTDNGPGEDHTVHDSHAPKALVGLWLQDRVSLSV